MRIIFILLITNFLITNESFSQKLLFHKVIGEEPEDEISLSWVHQIKLIKGNLAILDNQRIIIADTSGRVLLRFGGYSAKEDNTSAITDIEADDEGNYLVTTQSRTLLFSKNGKYLKTFDLNIPKTNGFQLNPSQIQLKNGKWYFFDQSNHNIKVFDKNLNYLETIGHANAPKFSEDRMHNVDKYPISTLIRPTSFFFYKKNNLMYVDYDGTLKVYDNTHKLTHYKKLPKVYAWVPVFQGLNQDIYLANSTQKEFYKYENDSLVALTKINQNISKIPSLKYYEVSSFCMDSNNIYVAFHGSKYLIAIFSRKDYSLKRWIPSDKSSERVLIKQPTQVKLNNQGELLVQERYGSYKKINLAKNQSSYFSLRKGSVDFTKEGSILHCDIELNRLSEYDSVGNLKKVLVADSLLNKPYRVKTRDNGTVIIDSYEKNPRVLHFTNTMSLKKIILQSDEYRGTSRYSADIDKSDNIYIAEGASVVVYDKMGRKIRQIGGYGKAIRADLNIGLVKENDKLVLKLGDFKQSILHFESISHFEIYKDFLFIASGSKIVVTDLLGNVKGYIGGNSGSKIGEFNTIEDFTIWKDYIYIADYNNNRIVIYKIIW